MINVILSRPAGRQFFPYGRTAQRSTAVICSKDDKPSGKHLFGVGCVSERSQLFFSEVPDANPELLLRALYCVGKVFTVNEESMEIAVQIAGGNVIDLAFSRKARKYLSCDYTAESLREAAFAQVISRSDLEKIKKTIGTHEFSSDEENSGENSWEKITLALFTHLHRGTSPSLMA